MSDALTTGHRRPPSAVGSVLQTWRRNRRMSQLDLSSATGVTSRHISFVETGRSVPTRQMLDVLAEALDMPLRHRNDLYLAAGYAAPYRELGFDDAEMILVSAAVDRILTGHEPFPAVVLDAQWGLRRANGAAQMLFSRLLAGTDHAPADGPATGVGAGEAPTNVLEQIFGPLRPRIENWDELAPALLARARREAIGGVPDAELSARLERLSAMVPEPVPTGVVSGPVIDVAFRHADGVIERFFSTITTLGTPCDITVQELRIELFHPGDAATAARFDGAPIPGVTDG